MLFTEPDKVPAWPPVLSTFDDVAGYLLDKRTVTIGTSVYGVDFHRPVARSYAPDESAYTTDDLQKRFKFIMFGRLKEGPAREQGRHHFTLEGSQELPAKLQRLFDAQLEVLSAPVLADDLTEDDIRIEHCTDSDRTTGKGGKTVDVRPLACTVHVDQDGEIADCVQYPNAFPVSVGEWALVEATLHLHIDGCGYYPRTYEVITHHVRRLSAWPEPAPEVLSPDRADEAVVADEMVEDVVHATSLRGAHDTASVVLFAVGTLGTSATPMALFGSHAFGSSCPHSFPPPLPRAPCSLRSPLIQPLLTFLLLPRIHPATLAVRPPARPPARLPPTRHLAAVLPLGWFHSRPALFGDGARRCSRPARRTAPPHQCPLPT
ncbi:hypothetical protein B0H13DRAFT_2339810 [Mycena leptocephala]|nr:hypothetical protein B0H13DRAFT_2339810 [Mycena leptocephala]